VGPDTAQVTRGVIPAGGTPAGRGCEVTGPAAALYLLLWNRGGTGDLEVRGDARVLHTWREQMRVRWS
jgi:hypothetical protein